MYSAAVSRSGLCVLQYTVSDFESENEIDVTAKYGDPYSEFVLCILH